MKPTPNLRRPRSRDGADGLTRGCTSQRAAKPIILLVDDEPDNLDILRWFLREEGFVVNTAVNGSDALRSAQACVPDLAIVDYMMPGMNGIALCRRLRERPATERLPIILHTAADMRVAQTSPDWCVDRVVTKPSDVRDLVREVRELLGQPH
jgi:two-component system, OmpR family, phosphate regulon response regulator PhoB